MPPVMPTIELRNLIRFPPLRGAGMAARAGLRGQGYADGREALRCRAPRSARSVVRGRLARIETDVTSFIPDNRARREGQ